MQPKKALKLPPGTVEEHIEVSGLLKDKEGKIYSDWDTMLAIKREEAEIKREEWEKKREDVVKRWSEIAEKNPGLTPEELKEIYIRHYPGEDEDIERYLEERETQVHFNQKDNVKYEDKELKYCGNCKQWVTPTGGPGGAVAVLIVLGFVFIFFGLLVPPAEALGILMIIVAIIYGIIKAGSGDRCPICNSQNWGEPPKE